MVQLVYCAENRTISVPVKGRGGEDLKNVMETVYFITLSLELY